MDPLTQSRIADRIQEIERELGLSDTTRLASGKSAAEHDLAEIEELYAEREHLLQELKKAS